MEHFEPSSAMNRVQKSPLRNLKTIILEIDWEINDKTMTGLIDQIEKLKIQFHKDKIRFLFLQLLGSVGKYIRTQKASAHPGAIRLLNSVYMSLEHVFLSSKMTEKKKRDLLFMEVDKFTQLKKEIAISKADATSEKNTSPHDPIIQNDVEHLPSHEALVFMLDEIKKVIRDEFKSLRAELKL